MLGIAALNERRTFVHTIESFEPPPSNRLGPEFYVEDTFPVLHSNQSSLGLPLSRELDFFFFFL